MATLMDLFKSDFSTSAPGDMKNPTGLPQIGNVFAGKTRAWSLAEAESGIHEYEKMVSGSGGDRPSTGYEDAW